MSDHPGDRSNGGWNAHFAETLSMRDDEGARGPITLPRVSVLFLVLDILASVVPVAGVAAFMFASTDGADLRSVLQNVRN